MADDRDLVPQPIIASPEVVSCELGEGIALLHLKKNVYFSLNAVGAEVWEFIQSASSKEDIFEYISDKFHIQKEVCSRDIELLLSDLKNNDLLVIS